MEWATSLDPNGAAFCKEYFPSSAAGVGNLYLNPEVRKRPCPYSRWYAPARRLDRQPDFVGELCDVLDSHNHLCARPEQPGQGHRGGLRPGFCNGSHAGGARSGQSGQRPRGL